MRPLRHARRGFTLAQLLLLAAILAALIITLLPAVQAAREAERRLLCREHLSHLGLALLNYHENHKVLPPGIVAPADPAGMPSCRFVAPPGGGTCDLPNFARASGLTLLLPHFGEQAAHDHYNFRLACCAAPNNTAVATVSKTLLCPSNPRTGASPILWGYYVSAGSPGVAAGAAPTDYVFSAGGTGQLTCQNPFVVPNTPPAGAMPGHLRPATGAFGVNSNVNMGMVKDGLTNTIFMVESAGGGKLRAGANAAGLIVGGAEPMAGLKPAFVCDQPWSQGYLGAQDKTGGYGSVFAATAFNAWYAAPNVLAPADQWFPIPVNEQFPARNRPTWAASSATQYGAAADGSALNGARGGLQGFRSYHPQIAQAVWGDGSVRALATSTDPRALVSYSTIRGGENFALPE